MTDNQDKMKWDKKLNIGVKWIDIQHKKLFDRLAGLLDAITGGKGKHEILDTLEFLEDYVKIHFATEEKFMIKYKYPKYKAHKKHHSDFIELVQNNKESYEKSGGSRELIIKVCDDVWNWYQDHIAKVDLAFGRFLKDKKITDYDIRITIWAEKIKQLLESQDILESEDKKNKTVKEVRRILNLIDKEKSNFK